MIVSKVTVSLPKSQIVNLSATKRGRNETMNAVKYVCRALYRNDIDCPHVTKKPDERCRDCSYSELMG
jgi:hypothetical protein